MIGSETKQMMLRKRKLSGRALEEYQKKREGQEKPKGTEQTRGKTQKERKREGRSEEGREGGKKGPSSTKKGGLSHEKLLQKQILFFGGCD